MLHGLLENNVDHIFHYFSTQWERQRTCQLKATEDGSLKRLEQRLATLLDLKEELNDAQ